MSDGDRDTAIYTPKIPMFMVDTIGNLYRIDPNAANDMNTDEGAYLCISEGCFADSTEAHIIKNEDDQKEEKVTIDTKVIKPKIEIDIIDNVDEQETNNGEEYE